MSLLERARGGAAVPPGESAAPPRAPRSAPSTTVSTVVLRVLCLGTAVGTAAALTPAMVAGGQWVLLALVWALVAVLLLTYSTRRAVPAKYLVPGTAFLVLLVVVPVLFTLQLSTTNYGDGTRQTREQAVASIVGNSVVPDASSPTYGLTVATTGSVSTGPFTYLLVDPATGAVTAGTAQGREPVPAADVTVRDGLVVAAKGYTLLTPVQVNAAAAELATFSVPVRGGAIRARGLHQAYAGRAVLTYDAAHTTITDTRTGTVYSVKASGDREHFVAPDGTRLSQQSWRADVGAANYRRVVTDPTIRGDFLCVFAWTLVFATVSVASTFALGLGLAVMLNDARVRGQKVYRSILLLPYAVPGFISILIWSGFFNRDLGLVNDLTGLHVDWLGSASWAKAAVLLMNLWLGFPYMFLVATGALQAIPSDLKEAARIDGASGLTTFRRITLPLLLVAVAPLLVASFAFNFNNYNVVQLLTRGGPFTPGNPGAGGTDILISYTVRLAFGGGGAQLGFASAIAALLFLITGVMAVLQFRATRALEEVA